MLDLKNINYKLSKNQDDDRSNFKEIIYRDYLFKKFNNKNFVEEIDNFSKYISPNIFRKVLIKIKLYEMTKNISGSIVECGVGSGAGFFLWILLKEILEPYNHTKKIIGFDTFSGFSNVHKNDHGPLKNKELKKNGLNYSNYKELISLMKVKQTNYPLPHINQMELIKGCATKTINSYFKKNKSTLVSILYCDFDNYTPTMAALKLITKHMCKGSVIYFDQVNHEFWPGETLAIKKFFNLNKLKLERLDLNGGTGAFVRI
jgi:hypothetical protein